MPRSSRKKRIAVVGAGIAGLAVARLLCRDHDISVFEARERIGGHTHTVEESAGQRQHAVDTGFIVFNEHTYPNFVALLKRLGVRWRKSDMSFSVHCDRTGLEYSPSSLDQLFAQRGNALRPRFWRMLGDLIRFRKAVPKMMDCDAQITLGQLLAEQSYGQWFRDYFIVPMGAAIWSASPQAFEAFPAAMFARFFHNHGFLATRQPQWLTIQGGSKQYLSPLVEPFRKGIHTGCQVQRITRDSQGVTLKLAREGGSRRFDHVILALHSEQALTLLAQPSDAERRILGAITYQRNEVVLHTDTNMLPRSAKARASWNYRIPAGDQAGVSVTYDMNRLQGLDATETFCVTLNPSEPIEPDKIRQRFHYSHPVYTPAALAAQRQHSEISGQQRTHYCGAYWGYGFHEDGVNSALAVAKQFGKSIDDI